MPRRYRSYEDADIYDLLERLEHVSDQECRSLIWRLIHDNDEARAACNRAFGREVFVYFDSRIHHMIVEGHATRSDVHDFIESTTSLLASTRVEMLVELGTDLVVHHLRWSSADLDALHRTIQEYLLDFLKTDIALTRSTWKAMDQLVADERRYAMLAKKLQEDKNEEERTQVTAGRGKRQSVDGTASRGT